MAQRVQILLTDDLNGEPATQTVRFALDGRELEIDLSDQNAARLRRAFLPYIAAGRRVGASSGAPRKGSSSGVQGARGSAEKDHSMSER